MWSDPTIAHLAETTDLPLLIPSNNLYEDLLSSIISQQISTQAAASIEARFIQYFWGFPETQVLWETPPAVLRTLGISARKGEYMRAVALAFLSWVIDPVELAKAPDRKVIEVLSSIHGIGVWSAQMILIFTLGRNDVFAPKDGGIRQAMVNLYDLSETGISLERRMTYISENWKPYRTTAMRLLWKYKDTCIRSR